MKPYDCDNCKKRENCFNMICPLENLKQCAECLKVRSKDDLVYVHKHDEYFCEDCLPVDIEEEE